MKVKPLTISTWQSWILISLNRVCLVLACVFWAIHPVQSETLAPSNISSDRYKTEIISSFAYESMALDNQESLAITPMDLNDDTISEYLVTIKNCKHNTFCPHMLVALPHHEPLLLLLIKSKYVRLSLNKTYGIRDLEIYDNPKNDYHYTRYVWDPFSFQYQQAEDIDKP